MENVRVEAHSVIFSVMGQKKVPWPVVDRVTRTYVRGWRRFFFHKHTWLVRLARPFAKDERVYIHGRDGTSRDTCHPQ